MNYSGFLISLRKYDVSLIESVLTAHSILFEASAEEIYQKFYANEITPDAYAEILKMDPTGSPDRKGKYLDWLIRKAYKANPRMIEDGYKISEYLAVFARVSSKIGKQIGQIRDQYELGELVKPYIEKPESARSNNEVKRDVKQAVTKLADSDGWVLLTPHNREAACYYGKNTKWCTAADEEKWNAFDKYNRNGPLYILINKSEPDEKFQFHFESEQYMDAEDYPVDSSDLERVGIPESMMVALMQAASKRNRFFSAVKLLPANERNKALARIGDDAIQSVSESNPITLYDGEYNIISAKRTKSGIYGKLGAFTDISRLWGFIQYKSTDMPYTNMDDISEGWTGDGFHADDESVYDAIDRSSAIWLGEYDIDPNSICEYLAANGKEDVIDELTNLLNDSYMYGAEKEMMRVFTTAVSDDNEYGMRIVMPGKSDSGNFELWCNLSAGIVFDTDDNSVPRDLFTFGFDEPSYGFSGFDSKHFNSEFIRIMTDALAESTQEELSF